MPSAPDQVYKHEGWQGYGHWLGTGNIQTGKQEYLPFAEALLYACSLKLKSTKEWEQWGKSAVRPANMPSRPDQIYKHKGWQGYGHWLGTGNITTGNQVCLPFGEALLYARSLKLKGEKAWRVWCKSEARLGNIPSHPERVYKHKGWQGYGHWLGTGNISTGKREYLPFEEALLNARSLKLKGEKAWRVWYKTGARPANIPTNPQRTYKHEGWQGYGHWLGTGNTLHAKLVFLPFDKALLYARSLKLKNRKEWTVSCAKESSSLVCLEQQRCTACQHPSAP